MSVIISNEKYTEWNDTFVFDLYNRVYYANIYVEMKINLTDGTYLHYICDPIQPEPFLEQQLVCKCNYNNNTDFTIKEFRIYPLDTIDSLEYTSWFYSGNLVFNESDSTKTITINSISFATVVRLYPTIINISLDTLISFEDITKHNENQTLSYNLYQNHLTQGYIPLKLQVSKEVMQYI